MNTMDNCNAFKYRVYELIDSKAITFLLTCPNVKTNPMSTHAVPSVSVMEEAIDQELIRGWRRSKPCLFYRRIILKHGLIPINHDSWKDCVSNLGSCASLNNYVQQLINHGTIQIGHPSKEKE